MLSYSRLHLTHAAFHLARAAFRIRNHTFACVLLSKELHTVDPYVTLLDRGQPFCKGFRVDCDYDFEVNPFAEPFFAQLQTQKDKYTLASESTYVARSASVPEFEVSDGNAVMPAA